MTFSSNGHNGILVFFTGHGSQNSLLLSDFAGSHDGTFPRIEFETYFGAGKIMEKYKSYKMYFVDSCRGQEKSAVLVQQDSVPVRRLLLQSKGSKNHVHAASNTSIMYSNSDSFRSYEVPYNEDKDDIQELNKDNYMAFAEGKHCGIFMNAVCKALDVNATNGFEMNYLEIEDAIMEKAEKTVVPVWNSYDEKVGQIAWPSGSIRNKIKGQIKFARSTQPGFVTFI